MWEPGVRHLGSSLAVWRSWVANRGGMAYTNRGDGCSWLRVGATRCLYPCKSHGGIRILTRWGFKLSCKYSPWDYEAPEGPRALDHLHAFDVDVLSPRSVVIAALSWLWFTVKF